MTRCASIRVDELYSKPARYVKFSRFPNTVVMYLNSADRPQRLPGKLRIIPAGLYLDRLSAYWLFVAEHGCLPGGRSR